jgi:hypothetical protein
MKKSVLKDLIELQNERLNQLRINHKVAQQEWERTTELMHEYSKEAKHYASETKKWFDEADRLNGILDKKDQEYQKLKSDCNFYKEKNDNLLILNSRCDEKIKKFETKCAENIARAERHYENLMAIMSLNETLRLFTQIGNCIMEQPKGVAVGMGYYMNELFMSQHQKDSIKIILNEIEAQSRAIKDMEIVLEAKEHIKKQIKEAEGNTSMRVDSL